MGTKTVHVCDGCGKQVKTAFLHIRDGVARLNNGAKDGRSRGFAEVAIEEQTACSTSCLERILVRIAASKSHQVPQDFYMIGEGGTNLNDKNNN